MNFADESAWLTADNVQIEVDTIQRSRGVSKLLSLYTQIPFAIVSLKKQRYNNSSCTYNTPNSNIHWMGQFFMGLDVDSVNSNSDYFTYLCILASETMLHQERMAIADRSHVRRQTAETNCKNELC
jgi:hypothetical protein